MSTRRGKTKGRLGQNEIRDKLLETFPEFEPDDIKGCIMGDTGEDIQFSPAARKKLPLSIEVKRRKSGMVTTSIKQAIRIKESQLYVIDQIGNRGL